MYVSDGLFGTLLLLAYLTLASGLCSTCLEGLCYTNGECMVGCRPGYIGEYCDENCPSRCLNDVCHVHRTTGTVTCTDGCEAGYCGTKCTDRCQGGCATCDRQCGKCNVTHCPERRYGVECSEICSERYGKCDRETGQCIRCRRGYYGDACTKQCLACFTQEDNIIDKCLSGCEACQSEVTCPAGFYGNKCEQQCSSACGNLEFGCNRATGECFNGCMPGYQGLKCNLTCSENCLDRTCDQTTGECSSGCVSGYEGKHCSRDRTNNVPIILLAAFATVAWLVLGIVNIIYLRRYKRKKIEREETALLEPLDMECYKPGTPGELSEELSFLLQRRTNAAIKEYTLGKIHVSAINTVVNMLRRGRNWVTITGNAGDGKTTLGFQVLKEVKGVLGKVYHIKEPEEYRVLSRIKEDRVIMLDDSFGAFTADQVLISNWKEVLTTINNRFDENGQQTKVIFVSRKNVLIEALDTIVHLEETIMAPGGCVDLSKLTKEDERLHILDHYLAKSKTEVCSEVKEKLSKMQIAFGFPQCSKMYSEITFQEKINIIEFFNSPLTFLDQTTKHLYNGKCRELFELMVKSNGTFNAYSEENDAKRKSLLKLKREQEGSYITVRDDGLCEFSHSSIYESVLSVICTTDPLFCVKYATPSVLRQKINLMSDKEQESATHINVKPIPAVVKSLANRFRPEIHHKDSTKRDYTIFGHKFSLILQFVKALLSSGECSDVSQMKHINTLDKEGRTMLMAAVMGKRYPAIHVLIEDGADVNAPDGFGNSPLLWLCKQEKLDCEMIRFFIKDLKADCNMKDKRGMAVLHFLCGGKNFNMELTQCVIFEGKGDINQGDELGITPLHLLCGNRRVPLEIINRWICDGNGDISKPDVFGQTSVDILRAKTTLAETFHASQAVQNGDKQLNCSDVWFIPTLERCLEDLVIKLQAEEKCVPVIGSIMTMCSESVHSDLAVEDNGRILTNTAQSGTRPNQFRKFTGSLGKPNPLLTAPTYLEVNSELTWKGGKVASVIEIGVVEGSANLDGEKWISRLHGSVSVSVEGDCQRHQDSLCIQVWKRDHVFAAEQAGECITLSPLIPNQVYNFTFGLVLDVARGRVAFVDVEKETLLCRINKKFSQEVFIMFGVNPLHNRCATRMTLVSSREITITDRKKELLLQCLSN